MSNYIIIIDIPWAGLNNECRPAPSSDETPLTLGGIVCSSKGKSRPHICCKKLPGMWGFFEAYTNDNNIS